MQSLFMYWLPNNVMSAIQTYLLKREGIRQVFKIPKIPETPPTSTASPLTKISEVGTNRMYALCVSNCLSSCIDSEE